MEELIPLLIGIIWLIYTIYSKGKRREARKHQTDGERQVKTPSILEQLLTGQENFRPQPYEIYEESADKQMIDEYDAADDEPEVESRPFLQAELADFMQEGQRATDPLHTEITQEKIDEESRNEKVDFNLKKAIIFSEILNAPYINYK